MKRPGHCTLCDTPVFQETLSGGLLPGPRARRVTLAMADGSTADVTFCDTCPVDSTTLATIHETILRAMIAESAEPTPKGRRPLDLRQQWVVGAMLLRQVQNVPLGVLHQEPWTEALSREVGRVR